MKSVIKVHMNLKDLMEVRNKTEKEPMEHLREALLGVFKGCNLVLVSNSFGEMVFEMETEASFTAVEILECKKTFMSSMGMDVDDRRAIFSFVVQESAEVKEDKPEEKDNEEKDGVSEELRARYEKMLEERRKKAKMAPPVMDKINALVGANQFKSFAEEINRISQFYKTPATLKDVLLGMSYLVAANSCDGRENIVRLLGELVAEKLECSKLSFTKCVVKPPKNDNDSSIDDIIEKVSRISLGDRLCVYVIELDEAYPIIKTEMFERIVSAAWTAAHNSLFIFTMPYLEISAIQEVHTEIRDIFCNRLISVSPYTDDMYVEYFDRYCSKYSMSLAENAKDALIEKIVEEKSDGSFYGIKTVEKICAEILYHKAKDATEEHPDTITAEDVQRVISQKAETDGKTGLELLDEMVGLEEVKQKVKEILATIKFNRSCSSDQKRNITMHMMFSGAPGTGKTAVARLIGRIFKEEEVLSRGGFFEVTRTDLVGQYIGHTGPKTISACRTAYGSVLFIDEAYSLHGGGGKDFGREAIAALIAEMENNRDNFVVVFAGYQEELEALFALNPGLKDRIPFHIHFGNYTRQELKEIFYKLLDEGFAYNEGFKEAADNYFDNLPDAIMKGENFSNARFARNLAERVLSKAVLRMAMENSYGKNVFTKSDFTLAADEFYSGDMNKKIKKKTVGFIV